MALIAASSRASASFSAASRAASRAAAFFSALVFGAPSREPEPCFAPEPEPEPEPEPSEAPLVARAHISASDRLVRVDTSAAMARTSACATSSFCRTRSIISKIAARCALFLDASRASGSSESPRTSSSPANTSAVSGSSFASEAPSMTRTRTAASPASLPRMSSSTSWMNETRTAKSRAGTIFAAIAAATVSMTSSLTSFRPGFIPAVSSTLTSAAAYGRTVRSIRPARHVSSRASFANHFAGDDAPRHPKESRTSGHASAGILSRSRPARRGSTSARSIAGWNTSAACTRHVSFVRWPAGASRIASTNRFAIPASPGTNSRYVLGYLSSSSLSANVCDAYRRSRERKSKHVGSRSISSSDASSARIAAVRARSAESIVSTMAPRTRMNPAITRRHTGPRGGRRGRGPSDATVVEARVRSRRSSSSV